MRDVLRSRGSAARAYEPQCLTVQQEYSLAKGMSQGGADMEERRHALARAGASNLHRRCSSRENSDVPCTRIAHRGLRL